MTSAIQKYLGAFHARPKRERLLIVGSLGSIVIWGLIELLQGGIASFGGQQGAIAERTRDLAKLQYSVAKYNRLSSRLADLEKTYANSELSVEQVYSEVENIVKAALAGKGAEGYELRSVGTIVSISDTVQQQGYSLKLKSLSLSQLVDLLYRLEQGKAPLFLGRLEITKGSQPGIFSANLELSSLRKKRTVGG